MRSTWQQWPRTTIVGIAAAATLAGAVSASAQTMTGMTGMSGTANSSWTFSQDGVVEGIVNHQGGPRGGDEFILPNWWMGMVTKQRGNQQFGVTTMLSLDRLTVGRAGYREIFQVGETLDGKPLIDHQHPHDFFMQVAASWKRSFNDGTSLVIAGGPSGEPTLGPVAFMHRPSAAGLPFAPLGHHTFDSTHVSFGVVSASVARGRWTVEGSAFNGREPDENRWDFDLAALDSFAGRVWFRPSTTWEVQVSSGRLTEPEILEPGDLTRTTTSASWFKPRGDGFSAMTAGYGVNAMHGAYRQGIFGEFTIERRARTFFARAEWQQVETEVLLTGEAPNPSHAAEPAASVFAVTAGAARRVLTWKGFEGAIAAQVTVYAVPSALEAAYDRSPVSAAVFFQLRLPTRGMGRMWNMRMSQGHTMEMTHAGHHMQ